MRRICCALCIGLLATLVASPALAKVINIPDFTTDPSGPGYTIQAMTPGYGATSNVDTISLAFNAMDPETGTQHMLGMNWMPISSSLPSQAGWSIIFGNDPDLRNNTLTLSIRPPGAGPGAPAGGGMTQVEVRIVDAAGLSCGGWGFNTDQFFVPPPGFIVPLANDPAAVGQAPVPYFLTGQLASMAQGGPGGPPPFVHNVTINIGNGPVPGSATVLGPLGLLTAPNYIIATAGGNLANAARLDFYENGLLAGNIAVPINGPAGLNNWWTNIQLNGPPPPVAEPAALGLLGLGLLSLRRRSR